MVCQQWSSVGINTARFARWEGGRTDPHACERQFGSRPWSMILVSAHPHPFWLQAATHMVEDGSVQRDAFRKSLHV